MYLDIIIGNRMSAAGAGIIRNNENGVGRVDFVQDGTGKFGLKVLLDDNWG